MTPMAERYMKLVLAVGEHSPDYVDAYYGAPAWREEVKAAKLSLALPEGKYTAEWISPLTGKVLQSETITATSTPVELNSPEFDPDVALRIRGK